MSKFDDLLEEELKKRKKKEEEEKSSSKNLTSGVNSYLPSHGSAISPVWKEYAPIATTVRSDDDDDIAPTSGFESQLSVTKNKDFKEKSGYVSTKSDKFWDKLSSKYGMGYTDLQHEYINNQNGIRDEIDAKAISWSDGKGMSSYEAKNLDQMTAEEVAVYNYYYNTRGKESAERYLDNLAERLAERKAGKTFAKMEGKTGREILYGVTAGVDQFKQGVKNLPEMFFGDDAYIAKTAEQIVAGKVREDLADNGPKILGRSLAQFGFDALNTGANMLPSAAVGALNPAAGAVLMGASAAGNAYQEDLNEFNDPEKAKIYAPIIGTLEGTLQYLLGGISKLGGTSATISRAVSGIKNGALRFGLEYAGKIGSESFEEGLQEILGTVVKNAVHGTDESVNWEDVTYSALLGGMMGGVFGAGEVNSSHLNNNESAVVDKEFNNRVAEAEQNGKKLTAKEKNKIYESVISDMKKGYISTDIIEEVLGGDLGGDKYTAYKQSEDKLKALKDKQKAMQEEFSALGNKSNATLAEQARFSELRQQLKDIYNEINDPKSKKLRESMKEQLSQSVYDNLTVRVGKRTNGGYLLESYNEKARAYEDFKPDFDKFKGAKHQDAVKQTLDSAVKAGINNTNKMRDFIEMAAKIAGDLGVSFEFTSADRIKAEFIERQTAKIAELEAIPEAQRTAEDNEILAEMKALLEGVKSGRTKVNGSFASDKIVVNLDSKNPLNVTAGHEVTHKLEKAKAYEALRDAVFQYAKSKKIDVDSEINKRKAKYAGVTDANPEAELVADLVGDFLFTDPDFISHLSVNNRNVFQKIYDEIKYLLNMATAGSREARELERVKREFEKAYRETEGNSQAKEFGDSDVQYSIREEAPPKNTGIAYKVFFVKDGKLYPPMVANPDGADTPMGVWLNADMGVAAPPSKTGRAQVKAGGKGTQGGSGSLAFRPGWHLGDLPRASQFDRVNPETGKKELFPENFVWAEVEYAKDVDYQEEAMSYGYTENGKFRHAYAGLPRLPENGYYRYRTNPKPDTVPWVITGAMKVNRLLSDAEVNKILEENGVEPVHRQGGDVGLEKFGFNEDGTVDSQYSTKEEVKYSLSEDTKLSDKAISVNKTSGFIKDETMSAAKTLREKTANRLKAMKDNGVAIPDDIKGNTAISNSSYDITEENTTICPRSLAAEAFTDAVSEYLGRPLTVEEQIYISQDLQGRSMTPECTYCYVATDRKAYRAFLGEYIKQRDAVLDKVKADPNADVSRSGELYNEFLGGRKDTNPMYNRFKMWVDAYKNGTPMVEASHLANISKLMGDINSEFGDALKPQIVDAMKYAQSASWAKKRVSYVAYDGHILKWKQSRIDKLNSHYGLRVYSFSDFHPAFVLENMQMVTDASVRGLKMLGYTKDTDFVEIFAPTGMNINISTFGFESGGNVYENNIIGAEWENAKKLRSENPNVGITFVATNDTLVEWALAQDWIDVVIPYHLVRTGAEVAKAFNYHNYTDESSDVKDVDWSKDTDKKYIAPTEHNNDKATYLAALQKNHLKPRFARFINDPNYMKLVNECRQSASESKPVQPVFGEDAIDSALAKLEANGYYQPIGGSVDRMYEIAAEVAENMNRDIPSVKYSLSDTEGRQLSNEQAEYFKDSVVRDENGNLKVMYHGTANGGYTVFNTYGSKYGLFGVGSYFTDSKTIAESYTEKYNEQGNDNKQVYETYLNITNPMDMDAQADPVQWQKAFPEASFPESGTNEEFYRAMEEYFYDEMYHKWEAAEAAVEAIMGMGYDGITHIGGGRVNRNGERHQVYIAFEPEQIKNTDNVKPTSDADIRYSLSDNEGNQLTEEQVDFFKDSKIRDREGNLRRVYHTTKNDFTVFDKNRRGEATDGANTFLGFFFAESPDHMEQFPEFQGGRTDAYYLDMKKPMDLTNLSREAFMDIVELTGGDRTEAGEAYDQELEAEKARARLRGDNNTSLSISQLLYNMVGDYYHADFFDALKPNYDQLVAKGYDGVIDYLDEMAGEREFVVFDSNQAKLASNTNPTSDPDIRRSISDADEQYKENGGWYVYGKDALVKNPDIAPDEDIAPVVEQPKKATPKAEYETIRPQRPSKKKQPRMVKVDKAATEQERIAQILDTEPTPENRKARAWAKFKANFLDKGAVFEDLSLKTKNRELMGKWNFILSSEARAQRLMGNGNAEAKVKSLNAIREQVDNSGKSKQFYDYLYHKHNVDRMNLAERYEDMENKPVFGYSVTSEVSQRKVDQYEKSNPAFKKYAQDVYDYMNYLRDLMVDNGVISQETADLWAEMYPHYVPIRRAGDTGLNINVPLDTGKTGVNAPVKKATGGNRDILPLFDTIGQRTIQTYKAIAKNNFGVELKNTLGSTVENSVTDVDEILDSIDTQEGLLQEGKNGSSPTFTVFENGEKVTFAITKDMYDALKPVSEGFAYTNKVLNTVSNVHRGLLTEYNPVFMLTNAIKDAQDILINSQHPRQTYSKIAEAFAQIRGNGYWYQEYMANGGEQNSYFDNQTNTFDTERKGLARALDTFPLKTISDLNNFIEMTPRLAEYIASREAGRSIEVSMLDAARVTTNFQAGGDVTKFLNRNGATFLNASVQGMMQNVRNFREANAAGMKGWANLATKFAIAGLPALLLNGLLWNDDEEYEELSDYVKQNYYIVGKYGDGKFIRIPKGRTMAVIQGAFEQIGNALTGDDEVDLNSFLQLVVSNLAPNNPIEDNIFAPIIQVANNETWYGEDLVPTRLQNLPAAEQYDESTDAFSKWLGEKLDISPIKINYLLDQYSGGVGDTILPMMTPEAESGDNSIVGNLLAPLKSKFTTDSVMNNQNVSDFYDTKDKLTVKANASTATDKDVLMSKYMNSVNSELSDLYKKKREIQNSKVSDDVKYERVRRVQEQIVEITRNALATYEKIVINGNYARVGDKYFKKENGEWRKLSDEQATKYTVTSAAGNSSYATDGENHYRQDDDGDWIKITDKQLEKQEKVTDELDIGPTEYWDNKEEYDYAYEHPDNYAVAKVVGGYESFMQFASELADIKANKDQYGKSIMGSRKEKVIEYFDTLDADYGAKLIMFKKEYPADDTYNEEIIEYLNNREDISYEDMVAILKELGFAVSPDGTVTWD